MSELTRDEKLQYEVEQDWYFTFGFLHPYSKHFVRFHGTFESAREQMIKKFGTQWAFQYSESELDSCILKYGCTEVQC